MRILLLSGVLLFLGALIAGCDSSDTDALTGVLLRIENASSSDFSSVLIRFPEDEVHFGAVIAGQTSEYQRVEAAYRYGYIEAVANGETYRLQPIDYVGEEPLENGHYTYELDIEESRLALAFKRD